MIKAIETAYGGCLFRSRLEARWAVAFDALGIKWAYEPEGFDLDGRWYLPDFWLPQAQCWAEVKPEALNGEELTLCQLLAGGSGHPVLLFVGLPDHRVFYSACNPDGAMDKDTWADCLAMAVGLPKIPRFVNPSETMLLVDWCVLADRYLAKKRAWAKQAEVALWPRLANAALLAKQARFEHGKTPVFVRT